MYKFLHMIMIMILASEVDTRTDRLTDSSCLVIVIAQPAELKI